MSCWELRYNIAALAIAMIREDIFSAEDAFKRLEGKKKRICREADPKDTEQMIRLKEKGLTYKQIGEAFGISKDAVYRRMKRYKEKNVS
ncbi:helix-turn-helix domain-containing protein [Crassaminicella profunda]|uniref:helix-turn-helix domain-containing protein n=1 Tax=Crassaminicella profunda TaxID=1286698 RepID=UPI001CA71DD3|nr:helix-turn-helix domain-containing protein [Crassaminicella profunda]QZY56693.1 helix-turn-helix domain-containing protein [Crassaminicella profunda]